MTIKLYLTGCKILGMTLDKVIVYVTIQWKAIRYATHIKI